MNTYWSDWQAQAPRDCPICELDTATPRYTLNVVNYETKRVSVMTLGQEVLGQLMTFCDRLEMLSSQRAKARVFRLNKMWYRTQR
jgi:hypothetical protein